MALPFLFLGDQISLFSAIGRLQDLGKVEKCEEGNNLELLRKYLPLLDFVRIMDS